MKLYSKSQQSNFAVIISIVNIPLITAELSIPNLLMIPESLPLSHEVQKLSRICLKPERVQSVSIRILNDYHIEHKKIRGKKRYSYFTIL